MGEPHAWVGVVRKSGDGVGGNVGSPWRLVLVMSAWWACVGALLREAACPVLCWGSRSSLYAWTCKKATEDTRVLMLSRIWLS